MKLFGLFNSVEHKTSNQEKTVVEIFKTNVKQKLDAEQVLSYFAEKYTECKFNFDLDDCDNILRVETIKGEMKIYEIINSMIEMGYSCELID